MQSSIENATRSKISKSNFHTHTLFCDGKNSIAEIARIAQKKEFYALGFSSHAMLPFSDDWHIKHDKFEEYCAQIEEAKKMYQNMKIRLGFEADFIPGITTPSFENYSVADFLIGAVHFVYNGKGIFESDASESEVLSGIEKFYKGNAQAAVERYFEQEREMLEQGDFSIIAHADVICRANCNKKLFDEMDFWYIEQLKMTADKIKRAGVAAEINTGGLARKKFDSFYPSEFFLSLLFERNVPITITSDCHDATKIDFAFEEAVKFAKKIGYTEIIVDFQKRNFEFAKI